MSLKLKNVAIISLYYNNKNYGGLLQAYALTKIINDLAYNAEQLCWSRDCKSQYLHKKSYLSKCKIRKIKRFIICRFENHFIKTRNYAFKEFEVQIPHSKHIHNKINIKEYLENYDAFVIGSDQVWNMHWFGKEYFFKDVLGTKYKFSYAASMPDTNISEEQKKFVKEALTDFNAISVREEKTAEFLSELCGRDVKQVLDPTLLHDAKQWDEIADKKVVKGKYIFCYFLGKDKQHRKAAKEFAKKTGLKIVTLPFLNGVIKEDIFFGKRRLYDISPGDFVSLIKNAEYVLTDSFHAVVFSNIYKVKYFVFNRTCIDMSERITTLLAMFETPERFIEADAEIMYSMKDKPVLINEQKFEEKKKESLEFLKTNLEKA